MPLRSLISSDMVEDTSPINANRTFVAAAAPEVASKPDSMFDPFKGQDVIEEPDADIVLEVDDLSDAEALLESKDQHVEKA